MCVVNVGEPADRPPARRTGPDPVSAEPPIGHAHSMTINNHSKPFVHYLTTITLSDAGVSSRSAQWSANSCRPAPSSQNLSPGSGYCTQKHCNASFPTKA